MKQCAEVHIRREVKVDLKGNRREGLVEEMWAEKVDGNAD